jgi:alpha-galactosidase
LSASLGTGEEGASVQVDPRFVLEVREVEGKAGADSVALVLRAREGLVVAEEVPLLFSTGFAELAELAKVPAAWRERLDDPRQRGIFSNGWQSWSYGGELFGKERVRPAWLITKLNRMVYREGARDRAGSVLSHLFTHVRVGEGRLVLVSRGSAPARAGAPIAFRINRRDLGIEVEAFAGGTRYEAGAVVAELRMAWREGFFAERDFLREVFAEHRHFYRLAFLENKDGLVPGGYESWYNHYTAITEDIIREDLAGLMVNDNLINSYYIKRGKPTVFQIDDGWEAAVGDWEPHAAKFPGGMATLAAEIEAQGLIPGLWVAPFLVTRSSRAFAERSDWLLRDSAGRPYAVGWNSTWDGDFYALDLSIPAVEDWLDELFRRIVDEWGYRYLKLDFLYAGMLGTHRRFEGAAWEHYDRIVRRITNRLADAQGRRVAWLGCGAPLESSFRGFPLMRIGADTRETWEYPSARLIGYQGRPAARVNLSHTIGRSLFDGALFLNDPDVVFCREKGMGYGDREKELIALVGKLLASQLMFSDSASEFGSPGEVALTERIVGLYDRLARKEFGVERIDREVFSVFSRDRRVLGWINLRDVPYALRDEVAAGLELDKVLCLRAKSIAGGLELEPRSISLIQA